MHEPAPAVRPSLQLVPVPSLTVTVPVGIPKACVTLKLTVYDWPVTLEVGEIEPMSTVGVNLFTTWVVEAEEAFHRVLPL